MDKDKKAIEALMPYKSETKFNAKLTAVDIVSTTRKTTLALVLFPMWAIYTRPYNLARLSAVTRSAGYHTGVYDVNIAAYDASLHWEGDQKLDYDPWNDVYMTKWLDDRFFSEILPRIKPTVDEYIDKLVESNPTVIGLTMYVSNLYVIHYAYAEIKRKLPNAIIMVGGPLWHKSKEHFGFVPDYIVRGEGEELILQALEEIEANGKPATPRELVQHVEQRIDLNSLPLPDYSSFTSPNYRFPNGAALEFSRGCIAKCVYCDETHYWKFRSKSSRTVYEEIQKMYDAGVNVFWFVDSLVNGNLKELRAFCKDVIAAKLNIKWHGWARCDGRMDLDYFKDLKAAGCDEFGYGVESGSNRVLADMKKGVTREEVEANYRDHTIAGMNGIAMMLVGFPTEKLQDIYESMTMLWRIRNTNLSWVASGMTCNIDDDTVLGQSRAAFGVIALDFGDQWITKDFANSKLHRLVRLKTFNIFLNNMVNVREQSFANRPSLDAHCTVKFASSAVKEVEYEEFDFNLCEKTDNPYADSIMNEVWPMLRLFWRTRGAFDLTLNFDAENDYKEFGPQLAFGLDGKVTFSIDESGKWSAMVHFNFNQPTDAWKLHSIDGNIMTNMLTRAKKLADIKIQSVADTIGPELTLQEAMTKDFSFNRTEVLSGKW
jgi:anaerobic magnesium-protoporphyrin IX monomethyl ester cyclase